MKKVFLLACMIASFLTKATEWEQIPTTTSQNIKDVYMANPKEIIIVGGSGLVSKTTDGGKTWNPLTVKSTTNVWEVIHFVNDTLGYLGGQFEDLYQTIDGGKTWQVTYTVKNSSSQIFDIDFLDINNGVSVGRSGELVVTTDGGKTWKDNLSSAFKHLAVDYVNKDFIYSVGAGQVASSMTSGTSWSAKLSVTYLGVSFVNDTLGFRVGANGLCEKTIDGGTTWTKVDLNVTTTLYDVEFMGMKGYIVGAEGVFETIDAGQTWTKTDIGSQEAVYSISFDKMENPVVVGAKGKIYVAKMPTKNWMNMSLSEMKTLKDVSVINEKTAIVVGASGLVKMTMDGGKTWSDLTVKSTNNQWETVHFVNDTLGYLGGQFENMYKTTDGGKTWTVAYTVNNSSSQIFGIDFLDINNGIAVGRSGELVVTTDGGKTWKDNLSSAFKHLAVDYVNKDFIYSVGAGQVASSITSGTSWSAKSSVTYLGVSFVNDTLGFRVGSNGVCEKTIDGGTTWTKVDLNVTLALSDVDFMDAMHGYIVGYEGLVFETKDAGQTWTKMDLGTTKNLYAIDFKGNTGYIVGQDGTVLTLGAKTNIISSFEEISNNQIALINVHPNPVVDILTISEEVSLVKIYNQIGKLVASAINTSSIDLSVLPSGIYIVHLVDEKGTVSAQKVVK